LAEQAIVPSIWPLEVANVAVVGERRKRLDEARRRHFLVLLETLQILHDEETDVRAFADIVDLVGIYQLFAYDAGYLSKPSAASWRWRASTASESGRHGCWRRVVQADVIACQETTVRRGMPIFIDQQIGGVHRSNESADDAEPWEARCSPRFAATVW
jgi:hypothetical protein